MVICNPNGHIKYFNMENFASFNLYIWQAECGQNASVEESKNWNIFYQLIDFAVAQKYKHISIIIPPCYPISKILLFIWGNG